MGQSIPFEPWTIAAMEERRIAEVLGTLADEARPWAGGVAACSQPGSWINQVINAGSAGAVSEADVEDIAQWYAARGVEPKIVIHPYVHRTLTESLAACGFVLRTAEIVLGAELDGASAPKPPALPKGVTIEVLDKADAAQVEAFVEMSVRCFRPGVEPPEEHMLETTRRAVHHPRAVLLVARVEGVMAGGAGFEHFEDVAALYGAVTSAPYRRRGIQQALIHARLAEAKRLGARWALVTSLTDSGTERNALRCGMRPWHTRLEMVRPGAGLVRSP